MSKEHPGYSSINPSFTPYGILLLRLALGTIWVAHALLKLFVFTLPGTAKFFDSVGLPGILAYPVFAAELFGGLAIILGIYGRYVALFLIPILLVAAWVHLPNGWVHTSPNGGWEFPVFLVVVSIVYYLLGSDGAYAAKTHSTQASPPIS